MRVFTVALTLSLSTITASLVVNPVVGADLPNPGVKNLESIYQYTRGIILDNPSEALAYILEGKSMAEQQNDPTYRARFHYLHGYYFDIKEDYAKAFTEFSTAIGYTEKGDQQDIQYKALEFLGNYYLMSGESNVSETCYAQVADYYQDNEDWYSLGRAFDKLGRLHRESKNYSEAQRSFERSLTNYKKSGDTYRIAAVSEQLALVHLQMGNINQANRLFTYAYQLATDEDKEHAILRASIKNNLGKIEHLQGHVATALEYDHIALRELEGYWVPEVQRLYMNNLASDYLTLGNQEKAQLWVEQALALPTDVATRQVMRTYSLAVRLYRMTGNLEHALDLESERNVLEDDKAKREANLNHGLQSAQLAAAQLKLALEESHTMYRGQIRYFIIASILFALITLTLIISLYRHYRQLKKKEEEEAIYWPILMKQADLLEDALKHLD